MASKKTKAGTTAVLVTFGFFMTEAIIHYNMGKRLEDPTQPILAIPPTKELIRIGGIVSIFSILSGATISMLTKND
jgi:hypothetical protein